jgi:CheY-like chemotaxis protein
VRATAADLLALRATPILIVEDNATNREWVESILTQSLMSVECAANAGEGFAALAKAQSEGKPFPLLLVDAQMPGIDGFEFVQKVKQNPEFTCAVVLMLSSGKRLGDAARCRKLGIDFFLVKPVGRSELLQAIQVALGIGSEKPVRLAIAEAPILETGLRARVLLAEDNVVNREVVVRLLEKRGHSVTVATDGIEAVALARSAPFDLVLMDVQMPGMDGYEATRAIRDDEKSTDRYLPIIAMTAHAKESDRQKCFEAGMDGFIAKPVNFEELVGIIENVDYSGPIPQEYPSARHAEGLPMDVNAALELVGGDPEFLREIAGLFLKDTPLTMKALDEAVKRGDALTIQREAHKLKGSVGNFSAPYAFDAALRVEILGIEGKLSEAPGAFAALQSEIQKLISELEALTGPEAIR